MVCFSLPLERTKEHLIVVLFLPSSKGWIVNYQSVMIVFENNFQRYDNLIYIYFTTLHEVIIERTI